MNFPTHLPIVQNRIASIDPVLYARSRNYLNGSVTRLSPYLSRGLVSPREILLSLVNRGFSFDKTETLVKELAWREFYQRVWQDRPVDEALRYPQSPQAGLGVCTALLNANTGIDAVDHSIRELLATGYMHNHARMYTAALQCTLGQRSWHDGARWMYYHLLDGDWASNACSWQWVAGCFSSKKYVANQENINRYSGTNQRNTFLDLPYEAFDGLPVPEALKSAALTELRTILPPSDTLPTEYSGDVFLYNYYHMDPRWCSTKEGLRILLIEPEVFNRYPVSQQCMDFLLDLGRQIPGLIIRSESFDALQKQLPQAVMHYREHPLTNHYRGIRHEREWMCRSVSGYFPSFFAYWKKAEREIRALF